MSQNKVPPTPAMRLARKKMGVVAPMLSVSSQWIPSEFGTHNFSSASLSAAKKFNSKFPSPEIIVRLHDSPKTLYIFATHDNISKNLIFGSALKHPKPCFAWWVISVGSEAQ